MVLFFDASELCKALIQNKYDTPFKNIPLTKIEIQSFGAGIVNDEYIDIVIYENNIAEKKYTITAFVKFVVTFLLKTENKANAIAPNATINKTSIFEKSNCEKFPFVITIDTPVKPNNTDKNLFLVRVSFKIKSDNMTINIGHIY